MVRDDDATPGRGAADPLSGGAVAGRCRGCRHRQRLDRRSTERARLVASVTNPNGDGQIDPVARFLISAFSSDEQVSDLSL